MKLGIQLAALAAVVGLATWLAWPDSAPAYRGSAPAQAAGAPAPAAAGTSGAGWLGDLPAGGTGAPARADAIDESKPAAVSLAETRLHGDPEAPPIARNEAPRERPTDAELADPKAYQAYETRQTMRTYASYIGAVDKELPRLREDIERGRAMGIPAEEIAKAEEKARGMEQMRAQLLKDHPELGR